MKRKTTKIPDLSKTYRRLFESRVSSNDMKILRETTETDIMSALEAVKDLDTARFDEYEAFAEALPMQIDVETIEDVFNKTMGVKYDGLQDFAMNAVKSDLSKFAAALPVTEQSRMHESMRTLEDKDVDKFINDVLKMGSRANIFDAFMKREGIDPDALTDLVTAVAARLTDKWS